MLIVDYQVRLLSAIGRVSQNRLLDNHACNAGNLRISLLLFKYIAYINLSQSLV